MADDLHTQYREWKSWESTPFGTRDAALDRYFQAELGSAGIAIDAGTFLIEVGFGNGAFAAWAVSRGATYRGTEIDGVLIARGREKGYDVHPATLDLASIAGGRRVDCIVAFDLIEHLSSEEALELLRSAESCLADHGRILIRFPSGDSPFGRAIQYGDMTHKSVIGSGKIRQLAALAHLHPLRIGPPAFPLWGLGLVTFFRRIPVAMARALMTKCINMLFHDNQRRVITPNMTVILRKAKISATQRKE